MAAGGGGGKEGCSFLELPSPPIHSNVYKPRLRQSALRLSGPDSGMHGAVVLETPQPEDAQAFTTRYGCQPSAVLCLSKSKSIRQRETQERCVCLGLMGRFSQRNRSPENRQARRQVIQASRILSAGSCTATDSHHVYISTNSWLVPCSLFFTGPVQLERKEAQVGHILNGTSDQ